MNQRESTPMHPSTAIHARAHDVGVRVLDCGHVKILWLPAAIEVSRERIEALITPAEKSRAAGFKSPSRQAEFVRTRWLIRHVTKSRDELAPSPSRAPTWPNGWVGSITHKDGHVAIALALSGELASLGIDLENAEHMPLTIIDKILGAQERTLLDAAVAQADYSALAAPDKAPSPSLSRALAVCFSFKEALFKCCFPLGETMFYFHDAEILDLDWQRGTIKARLLRDTSPQSRQGDILTGHFQWIEIAPTKWFVVSSVAIVATS